MYPENIQIWFVSYNSFMHLSHIIAQKRDSLYRIAVFWRFIPAEYCRKRTKKQKNFVKIRQNHTRLSGRGFVCRKTDEKVIKLHFLWVVKQAKWKKKRPVFRYGTWKMKCWQNVNSGVIFSHLSGNILIGRMPGSSGEVICPRIRGVGNERWKKDLGGSKKNNSFFMQKILHWFVFRRLF